MTSLSRQQSVTSPTNPKASSTMVTTGTGKLLDNGLLFNFQYRLRSLKLTNPFFTSNNYDLIQISLLDPITALQEAENAIMELLRTMKTVCEELSVLKVQPKEISSKTRWIFDQVQWIAERMNAMIERLHESPPYRNSAYVLRKQHELSHMKMESLFRQLTDIVDFVDVRTRQLEAEEIGRMQKSASEAVPKGKTTTTTTATDITKNEDDMTQ
jgi:hypothetical protein